LVVDKTGTLTQGRPAVATVVAAGDLAQTEVLRLAASLEQGSEHPLAGGIVRSAEEKNLRLSGSQGVRAIAGKGVIGFVDGHSIALGNLQLLAQLGIDAAALRDRG